jgi:hypothetical protein
VNTRSVKRIRRVTRLLLASYAFLLFCLAMSAYGLVVALWGAILDFVSDGYEDLEDTLGTYVNRGDRRP